MVDEQLLARGLRSRPLLAAMRRVPRHRFVPEAYARLAYDDGPLPIGHGQTISQPYVVAFMTDALALSGTEKVLEIGTGSGYQTAVLAELGARVWTVEIVEPLAREARERLHELGYRAIAFRVGDGHQGWPEEAPFDAILVTAAPDHVPQPLLDQLAVGGRMILPLGDFFQRLVLIRRTSKGYDRIDLEPVRFVPMVHEGGTR
jgi:protein-L-isoaspartate(D-aspartate) O-methyltransferase